MALGRQTLLSSYAPPTQTVQSTPLLLHGDSRSDDTPGKRCARPEAGGVLVAFGHHGMQLGLGRREHLQQQPPPWMGSTALLLW